MHASNIIQTKRIIFINLIYMCMYIYKQLLERGAKSLKASEEEYMGEWEGLKGGKGRWSDVIIW